MKEADRSQCVEVIVETFQANPGVLGLLKPSKNRARQIRIVAQMVLEECALHDGVIMSENRKGIALYKFPGQKVFSWRLLYWKLAFLFRCSGIGLIQHTLKREKCRNEIRGKEGFLYFWFLGVARGGGHAAAELWRKVQEEANQKGLDIKAETTLPRYKKLYELMGFKEYAIWEDPLNHIQFHFLAWKKAQEAEK